jgi:hypothetical protein
VAFGFSGSLDHSLTSQSARSRQVPPSNRYFINHSKPASAWLAISCAKPLPQFRGFSKDFLLRDLFNNINIKPAFPPVAAVTDNTAQVSTILDTFGYGSVVLALVTGTLTDADATFAVTLSESNDSGMAGAQQLPQANCWARLHWPASLSSTTSNVRSSVITESAVIFRRP